MLKTKSKLKPIGKYVSHNEQDGIRYAWQLDDVDDNFVESGAFCKRTYLGLNPVDDFVVAYTTSVSLGCILNKMDRSCKFCVTGNRIPFHRLLTAEEIALQNVFMVLDDKTANDFSRAREFAYMGQGEPGFSYQQVSAAIRLTDRIMNFLGYPVYRHIFATSGIPGAIDQLTAEYSQGLFGKTKILLHLSVHSGLDRGRLMPIDELHSLQKVIASSVKYSKASGLKTVVNFMLFKDAFLMDEGPFDTIDTKNVSALMKLLDPRYHRLIFCEYNANPNVGNNGKIEPEEVAALVDLASSLGFETKKFIAFGKEDNLACGLLGGQAKPNINKQEIEAIWNRSLELIEKFKNEI